MLRTLRRLPGASHPESAGQLSRVWVRHFSSDPLSHFSEDLLSNGTAEKVTPLPIKPFHDSIYVLGVGSIGKYVAHSLRKASSSPVTLLFHRPDMKRQWREGGSAIQCRVTLEHGETDRIAGFGYEEVFNESPPWARAPPINFLIVTSKTYMATQALRPLRHRLGPQSTILFIQNGMGVAEEVSDRVFPIAKTRPTFLTGICNAGVYDTKPFTIMHAGKGSLLIGPATDKADGLGLRGENDMLERLSQADVLETTIYESHHEIFKAQLTKLVVNAVINPLTALFRCQNGNLLGTPERKMCLDLLLNETTEIVRLILPSPPPSFTNQDFYDRVVDIIEKTAVNHSSMLQDVNHGRRTEIDYINGYLIHQAEEHGLQHPCNSIVTELIKKHECVSDGELLERFVKGEVRGSEKDVRGPSTSESETPIISPESSPPDISPTPVPIIRKVASLPQMTGTSYLGMGPKSNIEKKKGFLRPSIIIPERKAARPVIRGEFRGRRNVRSLREELSLLHGLDDQN